MGITAPPADPTGGGGMPPAPPDPASAGGGQGTLILQQVQQLLAQLMQSETDPNIQKGVGELLKAIDPLMQAIGQNDAQAMNSGLNTPNGGPGDLGDEASEGPPGGPPTFGAAKKQAMANFGAKGHFSKSGSKGEQLQTDKTKNRLKAKAK